MMHYTIRTDPDQAFEAAIRAGILSTDPDAANYAGHYMYMCTEAHGDGFKHRDTRVYVWNPR